MAQLKDDCFAFGGELLQVDAALNHIKSKLSVVCGAEDISIQDSYNRVLAEDVISTRDVPPHNNSAVDGYLVYFSDLNPEKSTKLPITGRVAAGHVLRKKVKKGEAVKIFTGARIPDGSEGQPDTIFMEEDCEVKGNLVTVPPGLKKGSNKRQKGEDIEKGKVILRKGRQLRPQEVGLIASMGKSKVRVFERLKVGVFSTGDEVRNPSSSVPDGCIFDSNRFAIIGLLKKLGCRVSDIGILPDKQEIIAEALVDAARSNNLIITSGGVSAGEEDHVREAVNLNGSIHFWRFAIKPGRPIALGQVGQTAFIGLPGNPVAAMITFMIFARPVVKLLSGILDIRAHKFPVKANFNYSKKIGRLEWVRSNLKVNNEGTVVAERFANSGSGILTSMTDSDGLVEIGENIKLVNKGDFVNFIPFSEIMQ